MNTNDSKPSSGGGDDSPHQHLVTIHVNTKPVRISGPKADGLEIKEAAIAQGVNIKADFILSEELPDGRTRIVGDKDSVTINNESKFRAVADDDNS